MPATEQVEVVHAALQARNPQTSVQLEPTLADKRVVGLIVRAVYLKDLSPIRGLRDLQRLKLEALITDLSTLKGAAPTSLILDEQSGLGKIWDLEPIRDMPLTELNLRGHRRVVDVTPLQGMPLTSLNLAGVQVQDLTPLKGMRLTTLDLNVTPVDDLEPLRGMPLTSLTFHDCYHVRDLAPLEGMPLTSLHLWQCPVRDLTPLKGMPLLELEVGCAPVQDLEPLRELPLTSLDLSLCTELRDLGPLRGLPLTKLRLSGCKQIQDLTPLEGLPLKEIHGDFQTPQHIQSLRAIKTLEMINSLPAAEFYENAPPSCGADSN